MMMSYFIVESSNIIVKEARINNREKIQSQTPREAYDLYTDEYSSFEGLRVALVLIHLNGGEPLRYVATLT